MHWLAVFQDDPEQHQARSTLLNEHFAYLAKHAAQICLAGGIRPDGNSQWVGGVWVLSVESREQAVRLCENDPFFIGGLRSSYHLYQWGRAPCFGDIGSLKI